MRRPAALRDVRFWLIAAALASALAGIPRPRIALRQLQLDVLLVIDITGSMNVRDYGGSDRPRSRLDQVKQAVTRLVAEMPCGSKAGLAVFSERRPFLLLAPVDACDNFAPLAAAVAELDWRMAWEGDSRIASGVFGSIDLARSLDADLVFFSDGQESPPLPASGGPVFEEGARKVRGLLVGTGGDALSPIPKFDGEGREVGFLAESDVEQESRFGLPPAGAEQRPGYNPRNAPFGGEAAHGNEHLSSVREAYLQSLAQRTGLGYERLDERADLLDAIARRATPKYAAIAFDLRPWFAAAAALLFAAAYATAAFAALRRRVARKSSFLAIRTEEKKPMSLVVNRIVAAALLALPLSLSAHGPTPHKIDESIEIARPAAEVWAKIADFGAAAGWNPMIAKSSAAKGNASGSERELTLKSGGVLVESLDEYDASKMTYSYRLLHEDVAAFPVSFYSATITVRPSDAGSKVEWTGAFYRGDTQNDPPENLSDAAAEKAMTEFYRNGLEGLKRAVEK